MRHIHFGDDLERMVAEILERKGIDFIHESECAGAFNLDFYLTGYDVYIEVKKYNTERSVRQLQRYDNIIFIQGMKSILFLKSIL